jgi:hypothetical protein
VAHSGDVNVERDIWQGQERDMSSRQEKRWTQAVLTIHNKQAEGSEARIVWPQGGRVDLALLNIVVQHVPR